MDQAGEIRGAGRRVTKAISRSARLASARGGREQITRPEHPPGSRGLSTRPRHATAKAAKH
jgi:hypothetical protein